MRRFRTALPLGLGLVAWACADARPSEPVAREASALGGARAAYYVVLKGEPAVSRIPAGVDPRSDQASAAAQARLRELETEHASLRPELEQHGAVVIAELSRLANVIQVLATRAQVERIRHLPAVERVEEVPLLEPALASLLPVVGAPAVWSKSTPYQGDGVTIGVIDSGIDYTHADFGGPGTTAAYTGNNSKLIEAGTFPTARVVGGWDFVGDDYNPSANNDLPQPDPDPLDCTKPESMVVAGGHGTHVAGIAAGNGVAQNGAAYLGPYELSFNPTAFRIAPGVAPRAKLWALRVFGCDGATTMLGAALERAADPNQDGSFSDRLDVVNGSLGTGYGLSSQTNATAIANLTKVGTLVVAAAGNDGQTFFVTGSPATIPQVLSVAASADNEFLSLSTTSTSAGAAKYAAAEGGFSKRLIDTGPVSGTLVQSQPANGCTAFANASAVAGKVALVDRGVCSFVQKFQNAQAAGALAVVIVDDQDDPLPFAMGGGDPGSVPIPGVMIRLADGQTIKQVMAKETVNVGLDPADQYTGVGAELLAGFSSRGPSALDSRLKPEIAAPGFSIDSARVGSGNEPRRSQGTSQASPVVSGAAALVRQAHPSYSPMEVKAALVNSTEPLVSLSAQPYQTSIVGSGRVAVERAVTQLVTAGADVAAGEVGVAFGPVVSDVATSLERSVTVTNHGASEAVLDAKVQPTHSLPGLTVSVEPAQVKVAAGQSATVELRLSLDPVALGAPGPDPGTSPTQSQQARFYLNEASGNLRFSHAAGGAEDVLVPYHGSVRAAAKRHGVAKAQCGQSEATREITLEGGSAHPEPVVSVFQLGVLDGENGDSATDPVVAMTDIRATGAATDLGSAASFDEAQVFFAVAVSGDWTTPAHGPLSLVSIDVDADGDGAADYEVRAEARNKDTFFRDALSSATYQKGNDQRIRRLPLNLVTPDVAGTHPFYNSVVVLSARLSDFGLTEENATLSYLASAEDPVQLLKGEETAWATFDAKKPLLDAAKYGMDGVPLFVGAGPVKVDVAAEARSGQAPLDLLLLHHTNVAGSRFEVVSLTPSPAGDLGVAASAPESVTAGKTSEVSFVVMSGQAAKGVTLSGSVTGGTLVSTSSTQGSCDGLECALGDVPAGGSVTVTAQVLAASAETPIVASASVTSDEACEVSLENNTAKATLAVTAVPKKPALHPVGGCACRAAAPAERAPWAWLSLGLVGLAALRRRFGR